LLDSSARPGGTALSFAPLFRAYTSVQLRISPKQPVCISMPKVTSHVTTLTAFPSLSTRQRGASLAPHCNQPWLGPGYSQTLPSFEAAVCIQLAGRLCVHAALCARYARTDSIGVSLCTGLHTTQQQQQKVAGFGCKNGGRSCSAHLPRLGGRHNGQSSRVLWQGRHGAYTRLFDTVYCTSCVQTVPSPPEHHSVVLGAQAGIPPPSHFWASSSDVPHPPLDWESYQAHTNPNPRQSHEHSHDHLSAPTRTRTLTRRCSHPRTSRRRCSTALTLGLSASTVSTAQHRAA
jgi:hypothetical protein